VTGKLRYIFIGIGVLILSFFMVNSYLNTLEQAEKFDNNSSKSLKIELGKESYENASPTQMLKVFADKGSGVVKIVSKVNQTSKQGEELLTLEDEEFHEFNFDKQIVSNYYMLGGRLVQQDYYFTKISSKKLDEFTAYILDIEPITEDVARIWFIPEKEFIGYDYENSTTTTFMKLSLHNE